MTKRLLAVFAIALLFVGLTPVLAPSQGLWTERIAYDANDRIQYVGKAVAGTTEGTTRWSIYRLAYDGATTRIVSKTWAGGETSMKWSWTLRLTYTYS